MKIEQFIKTVTDPKENIHGRYGIKLCKPCNFVINLLTSAIQLYKCLISADIIGCYTLILVIVILGCVMHLQTRLIVHQSCLLEGHLIFRQRLVHFSGGVSLLTKQMMNNIYFV